MELVLTQSGTKGKADIAIKLVELVKQLPPLVKCFNCNEEPCKGGQSVPHVRMRPGIDMRMVAYYPEAHASNSCHGKNAEVTVQGVASHGQVMSQDSKVIRSSPTTT